MKYGLGDTMKVLTHPLKGCSGYINSTHTSGGDYCVAISVVLREPMNWTLAECRASLVRDIENYTRTRALLTEKKRI